MMSIFAIKPIFNLYKNTCSHLRSSSGRTHFRLHRRIVSLLQHAYEVKTCLFEFFFWFSLFFHYIIAMFRRTSLGIAVRKYYLPKTCTRMLWFAKQDIPHPCLWSFLGFFSSCHSYVTSYRSHDNIVKKFSLSCFDSLILPSAVI